MPERTIRLHWSGREGTSHSLRPRPAAVSPLATFAGGRGHFYAGDNAEVLEGLVPSMRAKVSLVYLDPPFLTDRVHKTHERKASRSGRQERGDEERPSQTQLRRDAFDDRWSDRASYLESLAERLVLCRELTADHGSVVVHVDPKTSHYVKVLMDEIFGEACFASEIVWRYRRWPSKTPNFQRVHDVLLRYRKCAKTKPRWNTPYEPLAPSTLATWGTTKQRAVVGEDGKRLRSSKTPEETRGVPMGDVWDIGVLAPVSRERTGYPTQKPEALLERLVSALTDPDDLVLDPYSGSGTTLAVAHRLGRRFVGIDASPISHETVLSRLGPADVSQSEAPRRKAASI